jgi:hypothetical protein
MGKHRRAAFYNGKQYHPPAVIVEKTTPLTPAFYALVTLAVTLHAAALAFIGYTALHLFK